MLQVRAREAVRAECMPIARRLAAVLREGAALNQQLGELVSLTTHVDPLRPFPGLELTLGSGMLFHWLRDVEQLTQPTDTVR